MNNMDEANTMLISIHALRKESDRWQGGWRHHRIRISIHALRKESDSQSLTSRLKWLFQSTLSVRRATGFCVLPRFPPIFQSTLSVRRATHKKNEDKTRQGFQSTLSVRRATCHFVNDRNVNQISIHALRKESDHCAGRTLLR